MARPLPVVAAAAGGAAGGRAHPRFEVADVVRAYADEYLRTHPSTGAQRRVLRAIVACRTAALGGHRQQCDGCGQQRIAYNSCCDRHCPKCQGKETARWMVAEQAMLLPVPYFHVVCTLPHTLNALVRANRRRLYSLLFRIAATTLHTFARDPRHLGAEPAVTMVLHTWGQTLTEHHHVHCVVSGGGLSLDGSSWISLPQGKKKRRHPFLFHVGALAQVFRGKFLAALERARRRGELGFVGQCAPLVAPAAWGRLLATLPQTDWVVYCKPPFGGPAQVLKYLSRYTHRVAISNRRLLAVGAAAVRFSYRDYANDNRSKEMTLPATEFLRPFLLHLVPPGFMRIRHYGITANRHRAHKLARARELLSHRPLCASPPTTAEPAVDTGGPNPTERAADPPPCPRCGGRLRVIERIPATPRELSLRLSAPRDTS